MSIPESLLSAALQTGLEFISNAGFENEARILRELLSPSSQHERQAAFQRAYQQAADAYWRVAKPQEADLEQMLAHRPFQEELVIKLLDPLAGDLESVSHTWGENLPGHALGLNRFFRTFENTLINDPLWGDLLERYQELWALARPNLAGGTQAVVVSQGGVAAGRDIHANIINTGTINLIPPAPDGKAELKPYFRALAAECGELPMGIIDEKFTGKDVLSLKDVYIDLDVIAVKLDRDKDLHLLRRELERPAGGERVALIDAIVNPETRRVVLLGAAGSGKTTFTNYLTYVLANVYAENRAGDDLPETLRELLPVRLVLRKAAAHIPLEAECGQAEMLWNALEADLKNQLGAGYESAWEQLRAEIHAGRSLVLLDGLDEVPEAGQRRACLLQAIEKFLKGLPQTQRVVLTARPYAYADPTWQLPGCAVFNLAPLSPEQVARFVERWYLSVRGSVNLDEAEATRQAGHLAAAIAARNYLADLASRPLLLTLMAALHSTGDDLPEDRADLYEKTIHLLLVRWQQKKEAVQIDLMFVRQALAKLAYQTHERQRGQQASDGPGDIPFGDLLACFYEYQPQIGLQDLTTYLQNRSGLLVEREPRLYCFAHRSFQEYLAACYLLDTSPDFSGDVRHLVEQDAAWWREVILLAMGKARQGGEVRALDLLRNALLPETLAECPVPTLTDWRAAALGGQALVELRILERQPKQAEAPRNVPRARDWLLGVMQKSGLPARERAEAGDALAALDDPRFDPEHWFLPREENFGFVHIPAGEFWMGSDEGEDNEKPKHRVDLPEFWIGRYPVTVAQFRAFTESSGYSDFDQDALRASNTNPIHDITWYPAMEYCRWLENQLRELSTMPPTCLEQAFWQRLGDGKLGLGLPSEAEWEKAARGADGRVYPWGDEFDPDKANTYESKIRYTTPVGCFPDGASPYDLLDMSGNVWEWTRSIVINYPYEPQCKRNETANAGNDQWIVLRGGMCFCERYEIRCTYRDWSHANDLFLNSPGFRVAISPFFAR